MNYLQELLKTAQNSSFSQFFSVLSIYGTDISGSDRALLFHLILIFVSFILFSFTQIINLFVL